MNKKYILLVAIVAVLLAALVSFFTLEGIIDIPLQALLVARWLSIASLIYYGFLKRSLTTTILISMVIGVELGIDFPEFSQNLKVLAELLGIWNYC